VDARFTAKGGTGSATSEFSMISRTLLVVLIGCSVVAQEPPPEEYVPWVVRADLLVVRLTEARALHARKTFANADTAKSAKDDLVQLVETGEAELVDWPILTTLSGNRAVTEHVREVRYPIEFARPQVVKSPGPVALHPSQTPTQTGLKSTDKRETASDVARVLGGIPTTFETRETGVTLEYEAVVDSEGKMINIQLAPQHVMYLGDKATTMKFEGKHTVIVEQPQFDTHRISTNLRLRNNASELISFRKLKEPAGMVELMVISVKATKSGAKEGE
jgi:hypothetical protein